MKLQRVIHILEDGRKKYSTHNGEIEKWDEEDLKAMMRCRERFGDSAYLGDFSRYSPTVGELKRRYPKGKIVRVIGYETEDHDKPVRNDVIF